MNTITVTDIISVMEEIAPPCLAENWDNVGLQIGCESWPVKKIWVALDPSPPVIEKACEQDVNLLITHHPLFFKPVKKLDVGTLFGKCLADCIQKRLSIYSAHTNLDSVDGGLNDILAMRIGLQNCRILDRTTPQKFFMLVIFCPRAYESDILTLGGQGYRMHHFTAEDQFIWWNHASDDMKTSSAHKEGNADLSGQKIAKIEMAVAETHLTTIISKLKQLACYSRLNYNIYPMANLEQRHGIGRVGMLPDPMSLKQLALLVKEDLGLSAVRLVGNPDLAIEEAAVCTGSGASLLKAFIASKAQVYISGDMKYHDAMEVLDAGKGIIDVGHFASEQIMVDNIVNRLRTWAKKFVSHPISIDACRQEKDPFTVLV